MEFRMSRANLFRILQEKTGGREAQKDHLINYTVHEAGVEELPDEEKVLRRDLVRFCSELFRRLDECGRKIDRFLTKNKEWLDKDFVCIMDTQDQEPSTSRGGRPSLDFTKSSIRTKRRKTEELRRSESAESLTFAARMKLQEAGKIDAAKLLTEMEKSPRRAKKIRDTWKTATSTTEIRKYSPEEALALFLEGDFTKHQYNIIRQSAKNQGADIYPSYDEILKAKTSCYPQLVSVSEIDAEVKLQALLDHTVSRIVSVQEPVLETLHDQEVSNMVLLSKWGVDGSSGQAQYKQRAQEEGFSDADIFFTSLVPLQLYFLNNNSEKVIVWQNPRPSSTRYCRPIRLQFKKESPELSRNEISNIEEQINSLHPTLVNTKSKNIKVSHSLSLTMVDGKICNAATCTESTQTCYVCGATPKMMNDLSSVSKRVVDVSTFRFGLSTLHAWIRCFETLLHISYRLGVKVWQVRGEENKQAVANRKAEIQNKFRSQLGLIVDQPKPGGSGTTNDGNTARRFFQNTDISAEITGINKELIHRFNIILVTITSGFDINVDEFQKYALETARLFVTLYPWYYMPASVHKILLHGASIISTTILPIGMMSEEAQESRNKHIKQYRLHHTRKMSRIQTNSDLINRLLTTSDPMISYLRQKYVPKSKRKDFPTEVIALLSSEEKMPTRETTPTISLETGSDSD